MDQGDFTPSGYGSGEGYDIAHPIDNCPRPHRLFDVDGFGSPSMTGSLHSTRSTVTYRTLPGLGAPPSENSTSQSIKLEECGASPLVDPHYDPVLPEAVPMASTPVKDYSNLQKIEPYCSPFAPSAIDYSANLFPFHVHIPAEDYGAHQEFYSNCVSPSYQMTSYSTPPVPIYRSKGSAATPLATLQHRTPPNAPFDRYNIHSTAPYRTLPSLDAPPREYSTHHNVKIEEDDNSSTVYRYRTLPPRLISTADEAAKYSGSSDHQIGEGVKVKQETEKRPKLPYSLLAAMAIKSSATGMMMVCEVYDYIEKWFPYYRNAKTPGWKNSVRHAIAYNINFVKVQNKNERSRWKIDPARTRKVDVAIMKALKNVDLMAAQINDLPTSDATDGPSSSKKIKEEEEEEIDGSNQMENLLSFTEDCEKAVKYEEEMVENIKIEGEE